VPGAVASTINPSVLAILRARRRAREREADAKLAILRRLRRQMQTGLLPRYTETRVEQSWNEQLFARVLGYQTLLSHDCLPFHLLPKNRIGNRYDDFSLGHFGLGEDRVVASAELKDPHTDLDRPQAGANYAGRTPVEQAFLAARSAGSCRFVLVSNFDELRLYDISNNLNPIAVAHVADVDTRRDLANLQSHFDYSAIIGTARREPDMALVRSYSDDHPAAPIPPRDGCYRVIARYTPAEEHEHALFEIEDFLRSRILEVPTWFRIIEPPSYQRRLRLPVAFADGWASVAGASTTNRCAVRVAMSLDGDVLVSATCTPESIGGIGGRDRAQIDLEWVGVVLRFHASLIGAIYDGKRVLDSAGTFGAELRDVAEAAALMNSMLKTSSPNAGVAIADRLETVDVHRGNAMTSTPSVVARLLCDLAAQFRGPDGGIGLDPEQLEQQFAAYEAADGSDAREYVARMR